MYMYLFEDDGNGFSRFVCFWGVFVGFFFFTYILITINHVYLWYVLLKQLAI